MKTRWFKNKDLYVFYLWKGESNTVRKVKYFKFYQFIQDLVSVQYFSKEEAIQYMDKIKDPTKIPQVVIDKSREV